MTAESIIEELRPLGSESYKRVMMRHGIREPFFGVKVEDLKKIQKQTKVDYQLALDLYATGNSDAMYLAGLIADDAHVGGIAGADKCRQPAARGSDKEHRTEDRDLRDGVETAMEDLWQAGTSVRYSS